MASVDELKAFCRSPSFRGGHFICLNYLPDPSSPQWLSLHFHLSLLEGLV